MKRRLSPVHPLILLVAALLAAPSALGTTIETLRDEIDGILARSAVAGNSWSIYIENEFTTTAYYAATPTTTKRPASVTKLFTTGGAFGLLGPDHRFETRIHHTGSLTNGILAGDLHIVPEHDFTWSRDHYQDARTPLNDMAAALYDLGLRQVSGQVIGRGAAMYDRVLSRSTVAAHFRDALIAAGISVSGGSSQQSGFAPAGPLLLTHQSIRLDQACIPLNRKSVNQFADLLLRHIGYKLSGSDSSSAGENEIRQWLGSIGIDTTGFRMRDGSGLLWSSNNDTLISALQSTELLRHMRNHYPSFETTLTLSCHYGTLSSRLCGIDTAGRVFGKTGTLTNGQTASLAGYVKNRHDGQIYYFSFIANGATDIAATRQAIDDCVRLLAQGDLPNDGPLPPHMTAIDNPDPEFSLEGTWGTGQFMGGYRFNYRWHPATPGDPTASASFTPDLADSGLYNVYVFYGEGANRSPAVEHRIVHREGIDTVTVDQTTGGGQWRLIGQELPFDAGAAGSITVTNGGGPADKVVIADAARWELVRVDPEPVSVPPLLQYVFDEKDGDAPDYGASPATDGLFANGSTRVNEAPADEAGRAFSTTSGRGHLSGASSEKLDRLERFTLTAWLNLRAAPAHGNRLLARQGGDWKGFSWGVNNPNDGSISAGNFSLNLFIGGENSFSGQLATADLSADGEWAFVAVSYDSSLTENNTSFYAGGPDLAVSPLGDPRHIGSGRLGSTSADLRVASTAATTTNTSPFAWFDDIRIYDFPLNAAQLEYVRLENLAPPDLEFEKWQRQHFTVADLADETITGPAADPNGDGFPNLLRYAFGLAPGIPAASHRPALAIEEITDDGEANDYAVLRFTRSRQPSDLTYAVQASSNLRDWDSSPVRLAPQLNQDGAITETYRDDRPIGADPQRFLRLEVTR